MEISARKVSVRIHLKHTMHLEKWHLNFILMSCSQYHHVHLRNAFFPEVMTVAGFVLLVLVISTVGFVVAVCVMCVINRSGKNICVHILISSFRIRFNTKYFDCFIRDKSSEETTSILDDGKDVACKQNSYIGLEGKQQL